MTAAPPFFAFPHPYHSSLIGLSQKSHPAAVPFLEFLSHYQSNASLFVREQPSVA